MNQPGNMPITTVREGLAIRSTLADFALLIGGAVATACGVAIAAMAVVLLLAR